MPSILMNRAYMLVVSLCRRRAILSRYNVWSHDQGLAPSTITYAHAPRAFVSVRVPCDEPRKNLFLAQSFRIYLAVQITVARSLATTTNRPLWNMWLLLPKYCDGEEIDTDHKAEQACESVRRERSEHMRAVLLCCDVGVRWRRDWSVR